MIKVVCKICKPVAQTGQAAAKQAHGQQSVSMPAFHVTFHED